MTWSVPYIDLGAQYRALKPQIDEAMHRVMAGGRYIGGEEVERFEAALGAYLGVRHVVSCGNGYDALFMALKVLGIRQGHKVFASLYTHISTHAAYCNLQAKGVLSGEYDVAIIVHMNGRMQELEVKCPLIEDACQAIGAKYKGKFAGTIGNFGCFSFHPLKVLSCAGDGGAIVTHDDMWGEHLRDLRNHGGGKGYGVNSRLDALQAAILNVKLPHLDTFIARRRAIAAIYEKELPEWVVKPPAPSDGPHFDTFSSYVIGGSPELLRHMNERGIECFSHIRTDVVSLPIYPEMPDEHIEMVINAITSYENTSHRI